MAEPIKLSLALRSPADVIPHLGKPTHWKQGRSAKALADCWFAANELPGRVQDVLSQALEYRDSHLLEGWLERSTDLGDGRGSHSQTDLMALIDTGEELAILAVEAKVTEPFGPLVRDWLAEESPGKVIRLGKLCAGLGLSATAPEVQDLRYQLLHRTMAAIKEAHRFRVRRAAVIVQSFCTDASGFRDFARFCQSIGAAVAAPGELSGAVSIDGIELRLGWAADEVPPGSSRPFRSVEWLSDFGRRRLSSHFFMRDFLYSDIAAVHGLSNVPDDPELAIAAGSRLCQELLEPIQSTFGRIAIRSAFRSQEVNALGNLKQHKGERGYNCASNAANAAGHIWDLRDGDGCMGATACIVVPETYDAFGHEPGGWRRLAWWIHDHLPYSELEFYPKLWAFNIRWNERPRRIIRSRVDPVGVLTKPGLANHVDSHEAEWAPLIAWRSASTNQATC